MQLKSTVDEYDSNHATALKKLQKKNDELEKLREKLVVMENAHTIASANAETALNQLKRTQGNEKNDYFSKLDQEKRVVAELRRELEQLQNENTKLMELIDKQKFDLDEARSGMRYYTNSPSLPMVKEKIKYRLKIWQTDLLTCRTIKYLQINKAQLKSNCKQTMSKR